MRTLNRALPDERRLRAGSELLLWLFAGTKLTVARWEGAVLTALFLAYMAWLVAGAV